MPSPSAPTGFTATSRGTSEIALAWVDGANTSGQVVFRNTADTIATASVIAGVANGVSLYRDQSVSAGTAYYYWLKPISTDTLGTETSSVTATTTGAAGTIGSNMVGGIIQAAKDRLTNIFPTSWELAEYVRQPEKNSDMGRSRTYGVSLGSSEAGLASIFGSYTQTIEIVVSLFRGVGGKDESDIETAEAELYQWADMVIRDFKENRLYSSLVIKVDDPSIDSPTLLSDNEAVLLKITFPMTYRNSL